MVNNGVLLLECEQRCIFAESLEEDRECDLMHIPVISLRKEAKSLTGLGVVNVKNGFTCIVLT